MICLLTGSIDPMLLVTRNTEPLSGSSPKISHEMSLTTSIPHTAITTPQTSLRTTTPSPTTSKVIELVETTPIQTTTVRNTTLRTTPSRATPIKNNHNAMTSTPITTTESAPPLWSLWSEWSDCLSVQCGEPGVRVGSLVYIFFNFKEQLRLNF